MEKTLIGRKIIHHRKLKGITQEALAEITGLNIRTIQRIEAGDVDPRLYTLKAIADALQVNVEDLLPEPTQQELNQIAVLHLMPMGFFLFPVIGNVLLPFMFWMLKREETNGINKHGKDILNSQLTYSIIASFVFIIYLILIFSSVLFPGNPLLFKVFMKLPFLIIGGLVICTIVFGVLPTINSIKVYHGKQPWKYPLKINFFK